MPDFSSRIWSSVGKKLVMGFTGLCLVGFITMHLLGNLMLFSSNPEHYNKYSHFLLSLGELLIAIELGLILFFLLHIISGISVWLSTKGVRPVPYAKTATAGGASRKTVSSMTMVYTGVVVLTFIVLHVINFKYGAIGSVTYNGVEMHDFYSLVYTAFGKASYVIWYVAAILLLGFHLRHGFWSAFQSLGLSHPTYSPLIYGFGWFLTIVLTSGFIIIPLWIFFTGGAR